MANMRGILLIWPAQEGAEGAGDAQEQQAMPHRHDDCRRGAPPQLLPDFVAGAGLAQDEEGTPGVAGVGGGLGGFFAGVGLGLLVASHLHQLRPKGADEGLLGGRAVRWHEDAGLDPQGVAVGRDSRAGVAGRIFDDLAHALGRHVVHHQGRPAILV